MPERALGVNTGAEIGIVDGGGPEQYEALGGEAPNDTLKDRANASDVEHNN
jgi:hypothetical protein